jgi:hypothetical protein
VRQKAPHHIKLLKAKVSKTIEKKRGKGLNIYKQLRKVWQLVCVTINMLCFDPMLEKHHVMNKRALPLSKGRMLILKNLPIRNLLSNKPLSALP